MQTHADFVEEKFQNCLRRFAPALQALGVPEDKVKELTFAKAAPFLIAAGPMRHVFTMSDTDALFAFIESSHADNEYAMQVRPVYSALKPEEQKLLWRYAEFFFGVLDRAKEH